MASGKLNGTCYHSDGSVTDKYLFYAEYETGTPNIAGNYTPVTVSLKVRRNPEQAYAASAYNLNGVVKVSLTIDGDEVYSTSTAKIDTRNAQIWTFTTKTKNVSHNDDGSKSVKISASFSNVGANSLSKASLSGSVALEDIARASEPTVSASSVQMGNSVTINTNRQATSLTHTLSYTFGGATSTIATGVGASYEWTVPDLVSKIPDKRSGSCTITCKTYSGTKLVGTKTVSITLTIPAKSTPSVSASTVQMGTSMTVYTNRKSTGFTHTLSCTVGDAARPIGTGVGASKTWTPPTLFASHTGNKTSAICTITCLTYNGSLFVGESSTQITLTVPDATLPKLSASTVAMGSKITISMDEEASVYTHSLTYALKEYGGSAELATGNIINHTGGDYEWTVPLTLAAKIPSDTKATVDVICKTWIGTNLVGTEKASFTATVPNNSTTQPKVTMTVSAADTPFSGVFVAGKSKVKVSYSASSDYSTIKSYSTEILNAKSSANPYTSAVLTNAGTVDIAGKVTDARGYSTEKTASITVIDYSRPRIIPGEGKSKIVCTRCNSDKTIDPGGAYLLIQIGRKYSKVVSDGTQKNYCKLSYQWKTDAAGDDEYSDPVTLLEKTATSDYVDAKLSGVVTSNTTAYTIRFIAEDDVGETDTVTIAVPTAFVTWHSPVGGHGFTLGGYHDPAKYDVFDCRFDAEFQGNVSGRVLGMGALPEIPESADFNEYKDFGAWSVPTNATAATITNIPEPKAGTLRVWSSNGRGATSTGNYIYMIQEYIPYDNYCSWRRVMSLTGDSWNYGMWKAVSGIDDIVEQGTKDSWYYRKYANGTAECWRRVSQTTDITTQMGSFYYGDCEEVTFPFDFYAPPIVTTSLESGWTLFLMSWAGTGKYGTTNATQPASLRVARSASATGVSFVIAYHAIGRWK